MHFNSFYKFSEFNSTQNSWVSTILESHRCCVCSQLIHAVSQEMRPERKVTFSFLVERGEGSDGSGGDGSTKHTISFCISFSLHSIYKQIVLHTADTKSFTCTNIDRESRARLASSDGQMIKWGGAFIANFHENARFVLVALTHSFNHLSKFSLRPFVWTLADDTHTVFPSFLFSENTNRVVRMLFSARGRNCTRAPPRTGRAHKESLIVSNIK